MPVSGMTWPGRPCYDRCNQRMSLVETFQKYRTIITSMLPAESSAATPSPAESRAVYVPLGLYNSAMQFSRKYEHTSAREFGETDEQLREAADRVQEEIDFKRLNATNAWYALGLHAIG